MPAYAPMDPRALGIDAQPVALPEPRVFHLPAWGRYPDPRRVAILRQIVLHRGRDPRIRVVVADILRQAGVQAREYEKQAAVLLKWVQERVSYLNEPGEVLQDPLYTLRTMQGDCDDTSILLASFYESLRLTWNFVISGVDEQGRTVRWIEGQPTPRGVKFSHIYVQVCWPPFAPTKCAFAETTLKGAPLGWDIVDARARGHDALLPELGGVALSGPGAPAPLLPVSDPAYNLREICKQLALLEDHLAHPEKRCPDCIRKHLLSAEALADEAILLDKDQRWRPVLEPLPGGLRELAACYEATHDPARIAQDVRALRKAITPMCFGAGLPAVGAGLGGDFGATPTPVESIVRTNGVRWSTVFMFVTIGVTSTVLSHLVLDWMRKRRMIGV